MRRGRNLRALWPAKRAARFGVVAAFALTTLVAARSFFRISNQRDLNAYFGMASECHPVWKQFALRRFGPGDSAQELFRRFPPSRRMEFGRYGVYGFQKGLPGGLAFTSLSVITRDGKLLSAGAGSCTWQFAFFQTNDPELDRQYEALTRERHRASEERRLKNLAGEFHRFYAQQNRWPTDEVEFSWFISDEKPPAEKPATKDTPEMAVFRARYGLTGQPQPTLSGITLKLEEDGALTISSKVEPDCKVTIAQPGEPK